jgi:signal transduction histidine kinase
MKSDFLTTVSHELRTPLTSIMMGAELLMEEEDFRDPNSTRGKLVANIVRGSQRLSSLVNDLVAVSREDSILPRLEMEPSSLADAIANAVSIVQPLLTAKRQTLRLEQEDAAALVRIDRLRFEQVLINLLSNAQRYSPPGGHIRVATGTLAGGETLITISDSGPGVPAEDAERIFEPFYRGDRSGLGLGLAIAHSIVELHSGRIWVEPAPGGGSTFCVALPPERSDGVVPDAYRAAITTPRDRTATRS